MKQIFLLLFLVTNIIDSIEIRKEQYLKTFGTLKPEDINLVEKLFDNDDWFQQFKFYLFNFGEDATRAYCEMYMDPSTCQLIIDAIKISNPPSSINN